MKKKDISLALILILIAVYLIVSRLDIMPKIPIFTILFTANKKERRGNAGSPFRQ